LCQPIANVALRPCGTREGSWVPDYFETTECLLEYEVWCNARGIDALAGPSEIELRRDFGYGTRG